MMVYQEIVVLPDNEIAPYFILQKVYLQIHLALADNKNDNGESEIGISFPDYNLEKNDLGTRMRVFARHSEILRAANFSHWLERLSDYTSVSGIQDVPSTVKRHVRFQRFRPVTNRERLARRRARRHNESFEDALSHYEKFNDQQSKLPFINLGSLSTENKFKLFIKKELSSNRVEGNFSCYGLSSHSTVPEF